MSISTQHIWAAYESPFGRLTLTGRGHGLSGLFFPGRAAGLAETDNRPEQFEDEIRQLDEYFAGRRRGFDLPLDLTAGTPFQCAVWRELQAIPYGDTITYGELADRIGRRDRIRAVGAAVGRNPVPIIVPCHRVIGSDGRLTGYLGGLQRKRALLDSEDAVRSGGKTPIEFGARQLALL